MSTVLFIDSGVGGLSVWQEVSKLNANLNYVYVFDNKFFPYGEKDASLIIERCNAIVAAIVQRYKIDLVVVACNTASTVVLPTLRQNFAMPIVGVVPAIKPACALSSNKVIGLLATPATVRRQYIDDLIDQYANNCQVIRVGSSELVQLAERKMQSFDVSLDQIKSCLQPFLNEPYLDTIVLGCTHFPWLKPEITSILPSVRCVDSGEAIARRVQFLLKNSPQIENSNQCESHAFMTEYNGSDNSYFDLFNKLGFSDLSVLSI